MSTPAGKRAVRAVGGPLSASRVNAPPSAAKRPRDVAAPPPPPPSSSKPKADG